MRDEMRFAVGVLGNAACLMLYCSPVLTFSGIIRKKTTEGFSCVPYVVSLVNCLVMTWYGLPIVSHGWKNFSLITVNGLGAAFELCYIFIYLWFAPPKLKTKVAGMVVPVLIMFSSIAAATVILFHDHHHRKIFVGSFGLVTSVALYAAPLVAVKKVMETKSVEFMPFHLSFFSFLASSSWLAYGLLSRDIFISGPNFVGMPLAILQLAVYHKYKNSGIEEEPNKGDLEKNNSKLMQPVVISVSAPNGNI